MRSCRIVSQTIVLMLLLAPTAACSDDRNRQSNQGNMVALATDLSCEALANGAKSARWTIQAPHRESIAQSQLLKLDEYEELQRHFEEIGYDFDDVRSSSQAVPRVYLAKVPADFRDLDETTTRKQLFLAALLPAILQVNEELRESRRRLASISSCQQSGYTLAQPVQDWLTDLAAHYRTTADVEALLMSVAEIPPSLALAQAAVESGWGTSAPALAGNSLFGQYAVGEDHSGRVKKATWRLASFDTMLAAVRAYADNLNSHRAYREFRKRRAEMLAKGRPLDGMKLAEFLTSYSKRRVNYVRDVQVMIRKNKLEEFDRVDLVSRHGVMVSEN